MLKRIMCLIMAVAVVLSLGATALASGNIETNVEGDFVDRSGHVTRVDIPNGDGTFTSLEGEAAQAWYDRAVIESEQRYSQEMALRSISSDCKDGVLRGPFHYQYRYLESRHTYDVERTELERTVTNKLRNTSSTEQTYTLELNVSQAWTISPSVN